MSLNGKSSTKLIVVAFIVAIIMSVFAGCRKRYAPTSNEPVKVKESVKVSARTSAELEALSKEIKHLVKGLECSEDVAEDFVNMVMNWKDARGQPVLLVWKEKLAAAKNDYKQGEISKAQLAKTEENIAKELGQRIQKAIGADVSEKLFDLGDVIKHKQAQCLGYSQLVYILHNSIGLSVKAIDVVEVMTGEMPAGYGHIACILTLSDCKTIMLDLAVKIGNKPFKLEKQFTKVGNYWELKDKGNPFGIHRRIQILDRSGLVAVIYNDRGVAYRSLGQHTEAISYYTKAIELHPKLAEAYTNRGNAYTNLGRYTRAITDYNRAIEVNPKYPEAYYNRGNAYLDLGQPSKAISDCTKAIELNPKDAEAHYNRGLSHANLGRYQQAIFDWNNAIELNPKYTDAYNNRGSAYIHVGQFAKAISDCNKAIELNPEFDQAYNNRGIAYARLGQYAKAISDFTKAIKVNPKYANAYYSRGLTYFDIGQFTQAISDFSRSIELNRKLAEAYNNRGLIYAILGKFEEAKKDLLKAVELDPASKPHVKEISDEFKLNLKLDSGIRVNSRKN